MNHIKMDSRRKRTQTLIVVVLVIIIDDRTCAMSVAEKSQLKDKVLEMFDHAYGSYMKYAFPADELMPLSCKGRHRGTEPSRGDIDDALGNFTLTLIDTLDTLAVLGKIEEFESAVKNVIKEAKFDTDVVVSVFETNIRVLGGLLGAHCVATALRKKRQGMLWYNEELLKMAKDLGERLLPAFNTTTGMPFPRVNLDKGIRIPRHEKDTCTACAGTMILEFAALSRLTGDSIFEEKARKAMDFIWQQRHRATDLVGTVINIHNGDWVRRESGVGAGIDSYYEYVLKAYILLGDDTYLDRFNKHYDAVMKYVSQGPLLVDVQMHKPQANSRHFMDSLLAFWPGLQVLKGDIRPAIETHEMLYQVMQRHNFLPEAFTTDFRVHWGQHPLRPEFVESTYFLYKATGDHHYLDVGKKVIENLEKHARVRCGFAALKDVTSGIHEDQMDSFVLAETFKYLFLLFAEKEDQVLDIDDYLFTTEAHLLPLSLSIINSTLPSTPSVKISRESYIRRSEDDLNQWDEGQEDGAEEEFHNTCPNTQYLFPDDRNYADSLRKSLKDMVENICPKPKHNVARQRLRAIDFIAGNRHQLESLRRMGIRLVTMSDGRVQLLHTASEAASPEDAEDGMLFMQEMIELSKTQNHEAQHEPLSVQVVYPDDLAHLAFTAGPAQFGVDLKTAAPLMGALAITSPVKACGKIENPAELRGRIAILERGECMFIDKARNIIDAGAIAGIVIDHNEGSSSESSPLFAMSGDGKQDVAVPMVFLFHKEGKQLCDALLGTPDLEVILSGKPIEKAEEPGSDGKSKNKVDDDLPEGPTAGTCHRDNPVTGEQHLEEREENEWIHFRPGTSSEESTGGNQVKSGKYKMNVGSTDVHMEVKVTTREPRKDTEEAPVDDNVIKLVTAEDGSKQLSFKFDQMMKESDLSGKPLLNQLYVELVRVLQERTNFSQLKKQAEYLVAVARLLEAAYFNLNSVDNNSRQLFQKLADELVILPPPQEGQEEVGSEGSETGTEGVEAIVHESYMKGEEFARVPDQEEHPIGPGEGQHHIESEDELEPGEVMGSDVVEDIHDSVYVKKVPLGEDANVGATVGDDGVLYIPDDSEVIHFEGALHTPEGMSSESASLNSGASHTLKGDSILDRNSRTGENVDQSRTDPLLASESTNEMSEQTEESFEEGEDRL